LVVQVTDTDGVVTAVRHTWEVAPPGWRQFAGSATQAQPPPVHPGSLAQAPGGGDFFLPVREGENAGLWRSPDLLGWAKVPGTENLAPSHAHVTASGAIVAIASQAPPVARTSHDGGQTWTAPATLFSSPATARTS
jgi:hypothetical protein